MLQLMTKTGKVTKTVFIVRRYEIKLGTRLMGGSICNVVRSVKFVKKQEVVSEYQVWTLRDGTTTCDCPARGNCCHKDEVACAELRRSTANARKVAEPEETVQPAREMKVFTDGEHYEPRYRDGKRWLSFEAEEGRVTCFISCVNSDLAHKYIEADSDEHRAVVWSEYQQRLARTQETVQPVIETAETNRKHKSVPTPTVRNVSMDWLLNGGHRGGTFSGRVA